MSSGPKQTTTSNATTSTGPWQPSQGILQGILGKAGGINTSVTPLQQQGITGLGTAANQAAQFSPQISNLTTNLFNGGGFGTGVPGIQQATADAAGNLTPYANGSNLDPSTNPSYNALLQSIRDQVNNDVGGQFAAAGREFSGAQAGATAKNLTNALAPYMFNQYNQNVGNQFAANQALTGNALNASNAYDQSAGNVLGAQIAGPQSLQNFGLPASMQLAAGGAPEQTQAANIAQQLGLILPIAQTGQQGTSSGTSTTTQQSNPWMTALGAGAGLLGLGVQATGTGGILSGWNPWGTRGGAV